MHAKNSNRKCLILHDLTYFSPWLTKQSNLILGEYESGFVLCISSSSRQVIDNYGIHFSQSYLEGGLRRALSMIASRQFNDFDIYSHGFKPTIVGAFLSRFSCNRLFVFQHFSPDLLTLESNLSTSARKLRFNLLIWALRKARIIFVFCQEIQDYLKNLHKLDGEIVVVPLGITVSQSSRDASANFFSPVTSYHFVMAGRLSVEKNYSFALELLSLMKTQGIKFSLDIFGEGPQSAQLQKYAQELDLMDEIVFRGFHSNLDMKMSQYDLLLHTSISEGYGQVIVEALLKGIKVFSSNVGVARDLNLRECPNLKVFSLDTRLDQISNAFKAFLDVQPQSIQVVEQVLQTETMPQALAQLKPLIFRNVTS